jgi:hypothetical protein
MSKMAVFKSTDYRHHEQRRHERFYRAPDNFTGDDLIQVERSGHQGIVRALISPACLRMSMSKTILQSVSDGIRTRYLSKTRFRDHSDGCQDGTGNHSQGNAVAGGVSGVA